MMETSWFNPYPAWMGWVALSVVFTIIAFVWYRFRKKKAIKTPSKYWRVPVDGFADVFVTKSYFVGELKIEYTKKMAEDLADSLYEEMQGVWIACAAVYETTPKHGWCVGKIVVMKEGMPIAHPHVVWGAPHGNIRLLLQDQMLYWFARECHNVFRYRAYGMDWIYNDRDAEDKKKHAEVEAWIDKRYLHGE
jgi:hypothetical protein